MPKVFKVFSQFVQTNLVNDLYSCGGLIYNFLVIWSSSNLLLGDCFSNRLEPGSILIDLLFVLIHFSSIHGFPSSNRPRTRFPSSNQVRCSKGFLSDYVFSS
ncbi:hypothetical protein Hdeb2414_s0009g00326801 [Helianthus debilis subsp. tardiflorus]